MILEDWTGLQRKDRVNRVCDSCSKQDSISVETVRRHKNTGKYCSSCKAKNAIRPVDIGERISKAKKGKPGHKHSDEWKIAITRNGNPFFGKKHTDQSKQEMLKSREGSDWKVNHLAAMKKVDRTGSINSMFGKSPPSPKCLRSAYRGISFRSSWEMLFAKYLDEKGIAWGYEPFVFRLSDGSGYTPDFVIGNLIVEIKGGYWSDSKKYDRAASEIDAFEFKILMKDDLRKIGIKV